MTINTARSDDRSEPRQNVLHRTRISAAGGVRPVTLVNISPRGLMARTGDTFAAGERVTVELPGLGSVGAEVRWALGGRIGCQLDQTIGMTHYHHLLQTLQRA